LYKIYYRISKKKRVKNINIPQAPVPLRELKEMAALPEDIEAQILPSLKPSILENLTQKKAVLLEFFSSAGRFRQGDL
jgi:DNA replicative helicase MCM subunit Mcm2 (Cdc46/Mcm family)